MKTLLAAALLALAAPLASAQTAAASPLLGTWAVDVARLPIPPQMRPRSVSIRFEAAPDARLATTVEVIDPAGNRLHAQSVAALDGKPVAVSGNLEADFGAVSEPVPGVLVMQLARGGAPASTRVYSVSPDGQTLTETVAYFSDDGRPALRSNFFQRVRP